MSEKKRLMVWFDQVRAEMRAALQGADPGREVYPGWDMQADIAHITGWDIVTVKFLQAYLEGDKVYLPLEAGIDTYNEQMVQARAGMSFDEVLREWEETRESLKAVLAELSERNLEARITFPWGPRGSIGKMLAIIAAHEGEHAHELGKFK